MRTINQARRSVAQVNPPYPINRLQWSDYNGPGGYAICDYDKLHHNIASEQQKWVGPMHATAIAGPNEIINENTYILSSKKQGFPLYFIFSLNKWNTKNKASMRWNHTRKGLLMQLYIISSLIWAILQDFQKTKGNHETSRMSGGP